MLLNIVTYIDRVGIVQGDIPITYSPNNKHLINVYSFYVRSIFMAKALLLVMIFIEVLTLLIYFNRLLLLVFIVLTIWWIFSSQMMVM